MLRDCPNTGGQQLWQRSIVKTLDLDGIPPEHASGECH
jgi:hypothetical protein